jgi:hypothetical protein
MVDTGQDARRSVAGEAAHADARLAPIQVRRWSGRIGVEHRRFGDRGLDGAKGAVEQLPAPGELLVAADVGVARRERDAARGHDPRRADALGDRDEVAQQRGGDPGAFQFLRER